MTKKVIIETGNQERNAVTSDERKDSQTGNLHIKQEKFESSDGTDAFVNELESSGEDEHHHMTIEQKGKEFKRIPFNQYVEEWFYNVYSYEVRPPTLKAKQALLNKHIVHHFGDRYLHEIKENDIWELYIQKDREGYSECTILGIQNILLTLFRSAFHIGVIYRNPMSTVVIRKIESSQRIPIILSDEELRRLLEIARARSEGEELMVEFALSTGLRLSEILALSWKEVDFDQQTMIVKNIVGYGGYENHNIATIRSGYRRVGMPSHLLPKLKKYKAEQNTMKDKLNGLYKNEHNLVFPKKDGGVQRPATVRARFNRLVNETNIRRITFHDLRKTYAALLVRSGVSPYDVSKQLGYKSTETIINVIGPHFSGFYNIDSPL